MAGTRENGDLRGGEPIVGRTCPTRHAIDRGDLMRRLVFSALASMMGVFSASALTAEPLARQDVPEPLRPWVDWVLAGHEDERCPSLAGDGARACVWPGRLVLVLEAKGGRFRQEVFVARESDVALPGGGGPVWPEGVRIDGGSGAVIELEGMPRVRLAAGMHGVEGRFAWSEIPPGLRVPNEIALVDLSLEGRPVARPRRDADGALWLREARVEVAAGPVENRVDVEVARRFEDAVPPRLQTLVTLRVSGTAREELLGVALPEDWQATAISGPLPARLDPDGRLRVQLRPGDWTVRVDARLAKPSLKLAQPRQPDGARWDESEVWSVAPAPELRLLELSGAPPIDPTQAEIPPDWQALPTYRLDAGTSLELVEKRRGNEGSPGDQLTLQRTWYLDFDGAGATVLDRLEGTLRQSLRVEMGPGSELGRAAIGGVDQPITRRAEGERLGVETTLGRLSLDADSRIPASPGRLAAVGWEHDVDQLAGTLWLPPGYRLLHASGVDAASSTWVSRWNLLSVFVVLLMTVVRGRLFGAVGAAWALATLVLVWNEPGAPARIWLALAVIEALRRAVGHGRFSRGVQLVQGLVAVGLVVIAVPFAVTQLRGGLFPALAEPRMGGQPDLLDLVSTQPLEVLAAPEQAVERGSELDDQGAVAAISPESLEFRRGMRVAKAKDMPESAASGGRSDSFSSSANTALLESDPSAIVPTGPGRPEWTWERVDLSWSGPVTRDQVLGLWLVPPWANGLLAILRVAAIVGLAGLFVRGWRAQSFAGAGLGPLGTVVGGSTAALLASAMMLGAGASVLTALPATAQAEMPTPEMLDALRERLLENPKCVPNCAALSRLDVDVTPARLRLLAVFEAREETGVPLPGGGLGESSWLPESVIVDGSRSGAIRRDPSGVLWLRLSPGTHEVVLEGAMPPQALVQLPLPLAPHRTLLATPPRGYDVVGIGPDGSAVGALQFVREVGSQPVETASEKLEPSAILPFVELTRLFELGLRWRTWTRIQRIAPADGPIVLEVPLIPGESVTTPGIRVENGLAKLTLAADEAFASYESTLEIAPALALQAPENRPWSEVWQLSTAPVWHVDAEGIPPVDLVHEGARVRQWRPWPGEKLRLAIERPAALDTATRTIDRVVLSLAPGARATDATLTIAMRSSQGGQHVVSLPEAAQLTSLSINGQAQPLRQEGREVSISLAPGPREVVLGWREPRGVRAFFRSSEVGLGVDAVNAQVELAVPENRWLLFTQGPRLGPSVLFWSTLLVVAGLAFLIARTGLTPLRIHHGWLLGLGLTQAPLAAGAIVVAWFLALGLRGQFAERLRGVRPLLFRAIQIALALLTLAAGFALIHAIANGLLGTPDMRIAGNGSTGNLLRWYVDRTTSSLPRTYAFSLSIWWYRGVMLAWSMWLALALVEWARWGFARWSAGGMFRPDPASGTGAAASG